jgi:hypothetical protein
MSKPYPTSKKFVVWIHEDFKLELTKRLTQDNLIQTELIRALLEGYVDGDPDIIRFVERKNIVHVPKKRPAIRKQYEDEVIARELNLDESEIENMFDIIEMEFPDL